MGGESDGHRATAHVWNLEGVCLSLSFESVYSIQVKEYRHAHMCIWAYIHTCKAIATLYCACIHTYIGI